MKKTLLILSTAFIALTNLSNLQASDRNNGLSEEEAFKRAIAASLEDQELADRTVALRLHDKLNPKTNYPSNSNKGHSKQTANTIESDEMFARSLQQKEEQKVTKNKFQKPVNNTDGDFALALSIQEKEKNNYQKKPYSKAQNSAPPHNIILSGDLFAGLVQAKAALYNIQSQLQGNQSVHAFNKLFVSPHRDLVLKCNTALGCTQTLTPETIFTQIKSSGMPLGNNFNSSVQKLTTHLKSYSVDIETGLNVPQLLSSTWLLAQQVDKQASNHKFILPSQQKVNAKQYFLSSLEENIIEMGGCFPGFAGRLFQTNTLFLFALLDIK